MTCDATKESLRLAAEWTRYQFGRQYLLDGFPTRVAECDDYERGRAAGLAEAAEGLDERAWIIRDGEASAFDAGDTDARSRLAEWAREVEELAAAIRALASPEYTCIPTADLEALLDLHDGEPLGLAVPAYDRLRAAARRGRG